MLVLIATLRCAAALAGALLIYAGLFLRETEERDVENSLVRWWIRVDDLKRDAIASHMALTNAAAGLVSHVLDRLFGTKI